MKEGRKEGREEGRKEGKKEGRREGREGGREGERKEGRKEGRKGGRNEQTNERMKKDRQRKTPFRPFLSWSVTNTSLRRRRSNLQNTTSRHFAVDVMKKVTHRKKKNATTILMSFNCCFSLQRPVLPQRREVCRTNCCLVRMPPGILWSVLSKK